MIPHNYFAIVKDELYMQEAIECAKKAGVKLLVFAYGDSTEPIQIDNAIIFRSSAYTSTLLPNEVVMPAFVEDIGMEAGLTWRAKDAIIPTIGFTGWVRFPNLKQELKYQYKIWRTRVAIWRGLTPAPSLQGLHYRRKSIAAINKATKCTGRFIMRGSYSGHAKTIEADPAVMRKQFIDSITEADLSLVVRGDGNFSLRFFEVLSLGRIPVFVDTETPLPLSTEINYDDCMIRVPHERIADIEEIVATAWQSWSPAEYTRRQQLARTLFETKLRPDIFFTDFFATL
jgi:hypothetical protein